MILIAAASAAILWTLTGRWWIAIPVGVVVGYFSVIVFNAMTRPREPGPGPRGPDDPRRF